MGGGWGTRADWRRIPATASTGPNRDLRVSFLCFSNAATLSPPSPHPCAAPLPQCLGGETAAAPCLGPAYICRVEPRTTIDGPAPTSSPPRMASGQPARLARAGRRPMGCAAYSATGPSGGEGPLATVNAGQGWWGAHLPDRSVPRAPPPSFPALFLQTPPPEWWRLWGEGVPTERRHLPTTLPPWRGGEGGRGRSRRRHGVWPQQQCTPRPATVPQRARARTYPPTIPVAVAGGGGCGGTTAAATAAGCTGGGGVGRHAPSVWLQPASCQCALARGLKHRGGGLPPRLS